MRLDELEKAVTKLSRADRERLMAVLEELDAAEWDRQIEEDAKSGKLDRLAENAVAEHRAGRSREL